MTAIPKVLHEHINTAYPAHVCLIGTRCRTDSRRSRRAAARWSTMTSISRSGSAARDRPTAISRMAPRSRSISASRRCANPGCCRVAASPFYGTAKIYKSGPVYEEIWNRLIEPEKKSDPDKKGFGVLIKVERAEDLGRGGAHDLNGPAATLPTRSILSSCAPRDPRARAARPQRVGLANLDLDLAARDHRERGLRRRRRARRG